MELNEAPGSQIGCISSARQGYGFAPPPLSPCSTIIGGLSGSTRRAKHTSKTIKELQPL